MSKHASPILQNTIKTLSYMNIHWFTLSFLPKLPQDGLSSVSTHLLDNFWFEIGYIDDPCKPEVGLTNRLGLSQWPIQQSLHPHRHATPQPPTSLPLHGLRVLLQSRSRCKGSRSSRTPRRTTNPCPAFALWSAAYLGVRGRTKGGLSDYSVSWYVQPYAGIEDYKQNILT